MRPFPPVLEFAGTSGGSHPVDSSPCLLSGFTQCRGARGSRSQCQPTPGYSFWEE